MYKYKIIYKGKQYFVGLLKFVWNHRPKIHQHTALHTIFIPKKVNNTREVSMKYALSCMILEHQKVK